MANILILNGPNLNALGQREPAIYGSLSLEAINQRLVTESKKLGHCLSHFQSNAESELIQQIHQAKSQQFDFIIINPAALTHTSIALRDAFLTTKIPFIEAHLSNLYTREHFRHRSYLADIAYGIVMGFGANSYSLALQAASHYLLNHTK